MFYQAFSMVGFLTLFISSSVVLCFLGFAFGEDDLIHNEEDHHGYAAIQNRRPDVVNSGGNILPGHRHPDAVDGIDDAGNDAEGNQIPQDLIPQLSFAAEHQIALDGEIDALADDLCAAVALEL